MQTTGLYFELMTKPKPDHIANVILSSVGCEWVGAIFETPDGPVAVLRSCKVIWDGYFGLFPDSLPAGSWVDRAIHGVNDSDEAGYIVTVMAGSDEEMVIPIPDYPGGGEDLYLDFESGAVLETQEKLVYAFTEDEAERLAGWEYPWRDQ